MRRLLLVLAAAVFIVALVMGGAGAALAMEDAHCTTEEGTIFVEETCAGGSGSGDYSEDGQGGGATRGY